MKDYQFLQDLKVGEIYEEKSRKSIVEGIALGGMHALVYYGKGSFTVVNNRPIFYTSNNLIIKIDLVHRCGTEVKYYYKGQSKIDTILIQQLRKMFGLQGDFDNSNLSSYVRLLMKGETEPYVTDSLYIQLAEHLGSISNSERSKLLERFLPEWGRVVGHEAVGRILKIGSNVKNLTKPIGYLATWLPRVPIEYLHFKVGERVILQSRCARYKPLPSDLLGKGAAGVQLLGSEYEDVSRTLDGFYAQFARVTPELIQSGCVIRIPEEISDIDASLVEPTACLVDCLDLSTHPIGQDEQGNIMKKGVARDSVTAIIGSGSVAFIGAELSLTMDPKIQVGGASRVFMMVRSQEKATIGRQLLNEKFGDKIDYFVYDSDCPPEDTVEAMKQKYGRSFTVQDVIVAAGDSGTLELAHKMVSGTGWRIHALAGTKGESTFESGIWHYSNASTSGTSGCNTKAMKNVLTMIQRGTIQLSKYSGKKYTFKELLSKPEVFFTDKYLRPALLPNEDLPQIKWKEL